VHAFVVKQPLQCKGLDWRGFMPVYANCRPKRFSLYTGWTANRKRRVRMQSHGFRAYAYRFLLTYSYNSFKSRHRHLYSSLVHCALLLAMATPVQKTFTTYVGQMQRRRHHMTARSLAV